MGLFDIAGKVVGTAAKCAATVGLTGVQVVGGIAVGLATCASNKDELSKMASDANKTIQGWKDAMWK